MLQADPHVLRVRVLTPKERECLHLVAQNRSSKEIARELGISKASVDTYCNRARAKLGVASRRVAARLVTEAGPQGVLPSGSPMAAPTIQPLQVSFLPPLERLGPWQRVLLVLAGAALLALAFGMLLSGLFALDYLAGHTRMVTPG